LLEQSAGFFSIDEAAENRKFKTHFAMPAVLMSVILAPYVQNIHRRRFPEKQQHPLCRNLGCVKHSGITARMPRTNTAETSGHTALPRRNETLR